MFLQPTEIGSTPLADAELAKLVPAYEDIPAAFKVENRNGANPYVAFHRRWFFHGLPENTRLVGKDGVDPEAALRHLAAINRSRAIKHQHKEAAIAYLASLWIEVPELP